MERAQATRCEHALRRLGHRHVHTADDAVLDADRAVREREKALFEVALASTTFAESWDIIGPMFDDVMRGNATGA